MKAAASDSIKAAASDIMAAASDSMAYSTSLLARLAASNTREVFENRVGRTGAGSFGDEKSLPQ